MSKNGVHIICFEWAGLEVEDSDLNTVPLVLPYAVRLSTPRQRKHQRSPGFRPGKPNSGSGVERSLPCDLEKSRNAEVITAQIV